MFLVLALAAAVTAVLLMRASGRVSFRELAVDSLTEEALPELLQRLRDFHRVVTRNGQKLIEVSAKEASYFRDTSAVEIIEPKVLFFDKGEQVGEISGGRGSMVVEDGSITSVEVEGGAKIAFVRFEITADDVFYDREAKVVTTRGLATLRSDEFVVTGSGLTVDLDGQVLTIPRGVRMEVFRRAAKKRDTAAMGAP